MTKLAAWRHYAFLDELEKIAQASGNPDAMNWMAKLKAQHAQKYGLTGPDPQLMARKAQAQKVLGPVPTAGDMPTADFAKRRRAVVESRMQRHGMTGEKQWKRPEGLSTKRTSGPATPFETGRGRLATAAQPATLATGAAAPSSLGSRGKSGLNMVGAKQMGSPRIIKPKIGGVASKAFKILRRVA